MASTNKTTNYDLSQYIGTDKPTYLTDYNQDMSKIDAGIHAAKSEADTNASSIGTLSSLTTTAKTSLVAAINEVDAEVATNTNNIATNTSNIATNTTHIGTLTNLTTTSKTDLVVASNEINAKVGNLSNLNTSAKSSAVAAINEVLNDFTLVNFKDYTNASSSDLTSSGVTSIDRKAVTIATNSTGTIFKIYGEIRITTGSSGENTITFKNTGINPEEAFDISNCLFQFDMSSKEMYAVNGSIASNGDLTLSFGAKDSVHGIRSYLPACIYFAKDFGDVPTP